MLIKPRRPSLNVKITYFLALTGANVGAFLRSFVWFKLFQSFRSSSFWLRSSSSLQEVFKLSPSALSQHSLRFLSISPLIHFIILRALFIQPSELKILCLVFRNIQQVKRTILAKEISDHAFLSCTPTSLVRRDQLSPHTFNTGVTNTSTSTQRMRSYRYTEILQCSTLLSLCPSVCDIVDFFTQSLVKL